MTFSERIIVWHRMHGRHHLPWQGTRDPYRVWLSEIMLQQTQVATVLPYFDRFLQRFPDIAALAAADLDAVMEAWAGLGYYSRARNLHRCARSIVERYGRGFPVTAAEWATLPGIGRSTAAAIAVFTRGARAAILDGNVKRVLARHFVVVGDPGSPIVERELWRLSEREVPEQDVESYTQGLMDVGATICTRARPRCGDCPLRSSCRALREDRVGEFPQPRRTRARPLRAATLAVIADQTGSVLFERRVAAGIWGGLLSLPEFDADLSDSGLIAAIRNRYGLIGEVVQRLESLRHDFTHFSLLIAPRLVHATAGGIGDSAAVEWLTRDRFETAALPAPIRRVLRDIDRGQPAT